MQNGRSAEGEPANLTVALALARQGMAVFPVQSGGAKVKQPFRFFPWKDRSTNDEAKIRAFWREHPDAMPALDVGKSGLLVVDADRHDAEHDGVETWGEIMAAHGFEPVGVPVVATPNQGCHFIFRQDGRFGNTKGALPKGIDVRGAGGYIVAPGAVLEDGRAYELDGDLSSAPDVPGWLAELVAKRAPSSAPRDAGAQDFFTAASSETGSDEISDLLAHIPPDCGYDEWVQALMAVHAATGGSSAGLALADQWSARGSKYQEGEVDKKWRSFRSAGVNGATLAALARQYGADLSEIRKRYVTHDDGPGSAEHGAQVAAAFAANDVPPASIARADDGSYYDPSTGEVFEAPELPDSDAGAAADRFDLEDAFLHPGGVVEEIADWICAWTSEPVRIHAIGAALAVVGTLTARKVFSRTRPTGSHLYIGAIAPSGMGKQHPQDCIRLLLGEVLAGGKYSCGWGVSMPALANGLMEKASRVMVVDEFADKLSGLKNRNNSNSVSAISEALRTLWGINAGSWTPDFSVGRGEMKIERPAMSLYGASTIRDFTDGLVSKDVTNGLLNRFLILPRFGEPPERTPRDGILAAPEGLVERCKWLHNCLDRDAMAFDGRGDLFPGEPRLIPFSDAAAVMDAENVSYQKHMVRQSDGDAALALYGRYAEIIKRVAMIVACGRFAADLRAAIIEERDMTFARSLVRFSIEQFVLMVRRDMVEGWVQAQHKLILGIIRERKVISKGDLTHKLDGRIPKRDRDAIIDSLEEGGNIEVRKEGSTSRGGRPKEVFVYLRG